MPFPTNSWWGNVILVCFIDIMIVVLKIEVKYHCIAFTCWILAQGKGTDIENNIMPIPYVIQPTASGLAVMNPFTHLSGTNQVFC